MANIKTEVYSIEWKDIDLQGSLVSGASSGGAIGHFLVLPETYFSDNEG